MNEVQVPTAYASALQSLCTTFLTKNSQLNLSALRTTELCWTGNILDSIAGIPLIEHYVPTNGTILDIGTGGGFPLLPLATCMPNRQFTGLDSVQKKIDAIAEIAETEALKNVQFICSRTEDAGQNPALREQFDCVTSRAVAPLNTLLEYMAPFVKPKGHLLCWKSMHIQEESQASLDARSILDCHLVQTYQYALPQDFGNRQILVFQKLSSLSKEYPRAVGIPKKTPL